MHKIIYGLDTGSIEDYDQCVVVLVEDDTDFEELEEGLKEAYSEFETMQIVCWEDITESLALIMDAEGISTATAQRILLSLGDAVTNND